jgi:hypothetical protein
MFIYGADFFLFRPGLVLLFLGLLLTLPMTFGPVRVGPVTFSLYWMLLGLSLSVLGLHGFYMGALARVFFDYKGSLTQRWLRAFSYTRTVVLSAGGALAGCGLAVPLVSRYLHSGLQLTGDIAPASHMAVTGLLLVMAGSMNFTFTLALHAAVANVKRR